MKIIIDDNTCKNKNLSIYELMTILMIRSGVNFPDLIKTMKDKQMLVEENTLLGSRLLVTQRWSDLCDEALFAADTDIPQKDRIAELVKTLMNIFPEGRKQGTSQYWRGNSRDITLKLQKFFKLYGNKYSDEQIIDATKRYVHSFNGNYQFMRVLKYFISKSEKKINAEGEGFIEEVSDLAAYIENASQEDSLREDWITTLR